jgi:hypothetical protein
MEEGEQAGEQTPCREGREKKRRSRAEQCKNGRVNEKIRKFNNEWKQEKHKSTKKLT